MGRNLISAAIAALLAGSALLQPAAAQDRARNRPVPDAAAAKDKVDRATMTANQILAEWDAHTARIKADLRLTDDQEKNWLKFEGALHEIGQKHAQHEVDVRAERGKPRAPEDFIARLNRVADSLGERSSNMKKLAEATQALYESLDERQKAYLSHALEGSTGREQESQ